MFEFLFPNMFFNLTCKMHFVKFHANMNLNVILKDNYLEYSAFQLVKVTQIFQLFCQFSSMVSYDYMMTLSYIV